MPVMRIERRKGGMVFRAEPNKKSGKYVCHPFGCNVMEHAEVFDTLDEVADYLRKESKSGVRMNPGWRKFSNDILIDGLPR